MQKHQVMEKLWVNSFQKNQKMKKTGILEVHNKSVIQKNTRHERLRIIFQVAVRYPGYNQHFTNMGQCNVTAG